MHDRPVTRLLDGRFMGDAPARVADGAESSAAGAKAGPSAGAGRYDRLLETLFTAALAGPGTLERAAREAAAAGDPASPFAFYTQKVRDASDKVDGADIEALKAAGLSEEQIFELTVSASLGAARERLAAAQQAVRGGK